MSSKKENFFQILNAPYIFNQKTTFANKENFIQQLTFFSEDSLTAKEETRGLFDLTHFFLLKNGTASLKNYDQFVNTLSKNEIAL